MDIQNEIQAKAKYYRVFWINNNKLEFLFRKLFTENQIKELNMNTPSEFTIKKSDIERASCSAFDKKVAKLPQDAAFNFSLYNFSFDHEIFYKEYKNVSNISFRF